MSDTSFVSKGIILYQNDVFICEKHANTKSSNICLFDDNVVCKGNANSLIEARVCNRKCIRDGEERVKRGGDFRFMMVGVALGSNHLVDTGTRSGKKEERLLKRGESNKY